MERSVAVFEGFLMILSILSFSYLIGNEIGLVSANPGGATAGPMGAEFGGVFVANDPSHLIPPLTSFPATPPVLTTGGANAALPAGSQIGTPVVAPVGTQYSVMGNWVLQNVWDTFTGLASTAITAFALYFVTKWVAGLIPGVSDENAAALGFWGAIGYGIGGAIGVIGQTWFGAFSTLGANLLPFNFLSITPIGLIAAGVFILGYILFGWTDYRAYLVTFNCLPWQPVSGGQYCDECNKPLFGTDEVQCSKARCESLGTGCRIVDVGEEEEMCYWENKNDITAPEIVAWDKALSNGFRYDPIPATNQYVKGGAQIKYLGSSDGCLPPYQRFSFGISLNKLGYCKIDTNRTATYDNMKNVISIGYPQYNHTISLALEGSINEEGDLENPNENVELFVKCESTSGYSNDRGFVFKYCVQDELDTTAPQIKAQEPQNGAPVKQGITEQNVKIYVDKPSTCKWSFNNEGYSAMQNTMNGNDVIGKYGYYEYTATLTGIRDSTENKFYINCESYPALEGTDKESQRTAMTTNYVYSLVGTKGLIIDSISPKNETIRDSTENVKVTVNVKTSQGYNNGESICALRESTATVSVPFVSDLTPTYQHTQDLYFTDGNYNYEVTCCDVGGNCDTETISFSVETDVEAPQVVRVYNEGNSLKLITNEKAECVYDTTSCSYAFDDGVAVSSSSDEKEHTMDWDTEKTFYIKCRDKYGGEPAGDQCTIIVRPSNTF